MADRYFPGESVDRPILGINSRCWRRDSKSTEAPGGGSDAEDHARAIEGADPFTGTCRELLLRRPLDALLDVWTLRATFADLPRREVHFYSKAGGETQPPAVTVYFMGLPDTTPEFNSEAALLGYLNETLTRLMSGKGRTP